MLKFYRHCGEGWGWSGEKDYVRDNVPHGDPHSVLHKKTLEEIIEELIRADNKVTRAQMAEKIGVRLAQQPFFCSGKIRNIFFPGRAFALSGLTELKQKLEKI